MKKRNKSSSKKNKRPQKSKYKLMFNFDESNPYSQNSSSVKEAPQVTNELKKEDPIQKIVEEKEPTKESNILEETKIDLNSEQVLEISRSEEPKKKKFNFMILMSELLFWGGLITIVVGFVVGLEKIYIPATGLSLMIIALIFYAFSLRKHVEKNPLHGIKIEPSKSEEKKESKNNKEEHSKYDINAELNKSISQKKGEKPLDKKIKSVLTDDQRAEKELNKKYLKKLSVIISLFFLLGTILLILNEQNMLFTVAGGAIIGIFIAIILIAILQGRKKTAIQHKTGIMSKPSIEIETSIKNLKDNETEIDLFYAYILDKKSVLITTVAHDFGITNDKVEEWAKILESHNLIMIYYPAFGSPSLRILEQKKEENGNKSN